MKQKLTLIFLLLTTFLVNGQTLYSKAYGNVNSPAIIFIHGGPSGNSTLFEATTAQPLADKGFYVIIYDRRGEGRSIDSTATFTYQEAFNDLNEIYQTYKIEKANIIGHSFGGLVATLYSDKYPEKVKSLVLAGALFSQQDTYNHILKSVRQIYQIKNDTLMLKKVDEVEKLNKSSVEYRKGCYELAGKNDFFEMPKPTIKADKLRQEYETSEFYKTNIRNNQAPVLFYKNEVLNNIDTKPVLRRLKNKGVKLFAIYGRQDRIFSTSQINDMTKIVGKSNFLSIDNCSHYLFVDQQGTFIENIEKWIK
jgi:Predicted hydrolases or acyltransferases (alpha/beta hydrolase superfamily)